MATGIRAGTVTINAAFLQDIKELNVVLHKRLDRLRRFCLAPERVHVRPHTLARLLSQLRDDLAMHFSLEESLGYFDEPIAVAPWMSQRAEQLRSEHVRLYSDISRLAEQAEILSIKHGSSQLAERIASRYIMFHDQLEAHETSENELIMESLYVDMGVGD